MWRALARKLRNKIRLIVLGRFDKLLYLTWRNMKFSHFIVKMNIFDGFENRVGILQRLKAHNSYSSRVLEQAEKIINHRFNLLGSGEVDLGRNIDWHCDFKSGYQWSRKYYQLIKMDNSRNANLQNKIDTKVPWELSRLQHLVVLGQAYWLSGDEKYTREFMDEINSWIEENPPEIGTNWVCSMDISLRVVSLIIAYFFFRSSSVVEKSFWDRYFTLLYYSGVHIEQNQEVRYDGFRNNHHLVNCAAMIWLGLFFGRYNRKTTRWMKNGMADLCMEMDYQVNPDGGSFEGSISYHHLALETFLITTILAEKNGLFFPSTYKHRLEKMCEFSMHYTKHNGLTPQFGDTDDGRFCILSGYGIDDMRDHRSILGVAGEYFHRNDFRASTVDEYLDCLWLFGHYEKLKNTAASYPELVGYPDTGFYIIRNNEVFLMLKCGGIGQKNNGGHDHNDQLSFELTIDGVDLIIDPGSYVYTMDKDLRQLFRSTKYHNVSQIGNLEQNIIKNQTIKDLFTMYSSNPGICTYFDKTLTGNICFLGHITIAGAEIQYIRSVDLNHSDKLINIVDTFKGTEEEGTCRLHLAKDVQVQYLTDNTVEINYDNVYARIKAEMPIRIEPGMVSPGYGIKDDSIILSWNFLCQTNFKIYYDG